MAALTKSLFVAGYQCPKLLWWKVHEPEAPELQPDIVLQDRFDQGRQVTAIARRQYPEAAAEATFVDGDVAVRVDLLEAAPGGGSNLIEVKSSSSLKDEHIPDAAIQRYVVGNAGVDVARVDVMHLNSEFRHPDHGELLVRSEVTERVQALLPEMPALVAEQLRVLQGPLPDVPVGLHCWQPRACPFFDRCWPGDRDHIRRLHRAYKTDTVQRMQRGIHSLRDLPPTEKLNEIQRRQLRAIAEERLIVEPGLAAALGPFGADRVGHLDFETIQRAVPVWVGQKPWEQTAVQFSYHEIRPDGSSTHEEYLAEGPDDPRAEIADRLIAVTANADRIVHFSHFEKTRIKALAEQVPERADELMAIAAKLVDLLPVVQHYVYHPEFRGSFSLKQILTPLVPQLTYDDLVIVDGLRASVEIARLLFFADKVKDRAKTRQDLLDYCERDTWATVKLVERLANLSSAAHI